MLPPDKHDLQRLIDDLQLDAETRLHMLERHPRVVHFLASLQLVADLPAYWDMHTPALIQQFFQHPQPDLLARAVRLLAKAHLVTSVLVEQLIRHPDLPLLVHYLKRLAGHSHELFRQYAWYLTQHPELLQLIPQLNELLRQTIPTPEPWQLLFGRDTGWQHQLALQKLAGTSMVTPAVAEGLRQHDAPHACADLLRLLHRTQATHPPIVALALTHAHPTRAYSVLRHMELRNLDVSLLSPVLLAYPLNHEAKHCMLILLTYANLTTAQWLVLLQHRSALLLPLIEQLCTLGAWQPHFFDPLQTHPDLTTLYNLVALCAAAELRVELSELLIHPELRLLLDCLEICYSASGASMTIHQLNTILPHVNFLKSQDIKMSARLLQVVASAAQPAVLCADLVRLTQTYHLHAHHMYKLARWLRQGDALALESLLKQLTRYHLLKPSDQVDLFRLPTLDRLALLDSLQLVNPDSPTHRQTALLMFQHPNKVELYTALSWVNAHQPMFADLNPAVQLALLKHARPHDLLSVIRLLANQGVLTSENLSVVASRTDCLVTYHLLTLLAPSLTLPDVASHHYTHAPFVTTPQLTTIIALDISLQKSLKICLGRLLRSQLLTATLVTELLEHVSSALLRAINLLLEDGLLNQALLDQVVGHPKALAVATVIGFIPQELSQTTDWCLLLRQHPDLTALAQTLELCHVVLQRVPHNLIERLVQHPNPSVILTLFLQLEQLQLLHRDNVQHVILPMLAKDFWLATSSATGILTQITQQLRATQLYRPLLLARVLISDDPLTRLRQLMAQEVPRLLQEPQSTHRHSVHASTARAAQHLFARYQAQLAERTEPVIRSELEAYWVQSRNHLRHTEVALRCLCTLQVHAQSWREPLSEIGLLTLLALIVLAITDDTYRQATREDAEQALVDALYEAQRGGNIDNHADTPDSADQPICLSGMFNKMIEKMQSILPACEIYMLSPALAAMKLKALVREAIREHCQQSTTLETTWQQLATEGIATIWDALRPTVSQRLFAEFAPLYHHQPDHPDFKALVESGVWLDVPDFSELQRVSTSDFPTPSP